MWWFLAGWLSIQPGLLPELVREIRAEPSEDLWTWVGTVEGNDEPDPHHRNGRRTTLLIHHEDERAQHHYVVVWGHGMHGFHDFRTNMYPQLRELVRRGVSFTLIEPELPWSRYEDQIDKRRVWTKPKSFKRMVEEAMKIVPALKVEKPHRLVVVGHSRGGKSIAYAAISGGLCEMDPYLVLWSDATYGDWLKRAWNACLHNIPDRVQILYLKGTETSIAVREMKDSHHFDSVMVLPLSKPWFHGKIGSNALLLAVPFQH